MFQKADRPLASDDIYHFIQNAGYSDPTPLQQAVLPLIHQNKDIVVEAGVGMGRTGLILISLLMQAKSAQKGIDSLILAASTHEVHKVLRQYRRFSSKLPEKPHIAGLGIDDGIRKELRLLARKPGIVVGTASRVIDHIRRENIALDSVGTVVLIAPEALEDEGYEKDVLFIYSKLAGKYQTQLYVSGLENANGLQSILRRPIQVPKSQWQNIGSEEKETPLEEKINMSSSDSTDTYADFIRATIKKVREDENPVELNKLRKIFRKHTPLHLRAYVTAYLFKELSNTNSTSPGKYRTLFVSVGKNRKVFPKDLSKLFNDELGLVPGDLGNIKILDNYSFVDVSESKAEKAIKKLNDIEFRGRNITVNFARKRDTGRGANRGQASSRQSTG